MLHRKNMGGLDIYEPLLIITGSDVSNRLAY